MLQYEQYGVFCEQVGEKLSSTLFQILPIKVILFGCTILQGLAFLSHFKAAIEGPLLTASKGLFFLTEHNRKRSTQLVSTTLASFRELCARCGSRGVSGGSVCVAGQLSQDSEAITYTLSHTHGEGGDSPLGTASLHVSSSSLAPLGPSSSPSAFGSADSLEVSSCSLAWAI